MAKRKSKSESTPVSEKTGAEKTVSQESDKTLQRKQGSFSRFLCFFIPGVGFGGAFLLITALVMGVLFWLNKSSFLSDSSGTWQVEYNQPQGVWTGTDVLESVRKSNPDLFEKPYDDKTLLEEASNSFNLSPIVKKVKSVQRKFPNTIVADIEYFEPVAMVYVNSEAIGKGFLPVDKDGCQLPTTFFKKSDLDNYMAITGIQSLPMNPVGQCWNDVRVETASQIADELTPYKDELGIVGIHVHESSEINENFSYNPTCFDIRLKNHTFIRWTRCIFKSTGKETVDKELSTKEKIAILRQRLKEKGEIKPDSPEEMFRFVPESEPKSENPNQNNAVEGS